MAGRVFGFPNPVNEKAARTVAGGVLALAVVVLVTGWQWIVPVMALGFLARVLAGPRLSPLGQLATRVVAPRLGPPTLVAGPPKRFAQVVGLVVTTTATLIGPVLGWHTGAAALIALLAVFAFAESVLGFCAGCWAFGHLMRLGLVPEETCEACNDISLRRRTSPAV